MTVHGTEVINLLYVSSSGIQFVFVKFKLDSRTMYCATMFLHRARWEIKNLIKLKMYLLKYVSS